MPQPIITVLVPVYNVEKYLPECLDALAAQTLDEIEFILIDDGSTDNSSTIIDNRIKSDKRFSVIRKENSGYGASMNMGLDAVVTKYIGIVEPDDFPSSDMFLELTQLAEKTCADVVKSNYYEHLSGNPPENDAFIPNLSKDLPTEQIFSSKNEKAILKASAAIWSSIYRTDYLREKKIRFLETPGASFQDTSFNLKTLMGTDKIALTPQAFLHYRTDNSNSSVKAADKVFFICDEYREVWRFLEESPLLHDSFAQDLASVQFDGYCWNLWRLARKHREAFFDRFLSEFQHLDDQGLLAPRAFSEQSWNDLQQLLREPDEFFMRACGARGISQSLLLNLSGETSQQQFEDYIKTRPACEEIIIRSEAALSFDIWPIAEKDYRIKVLSEMCPSGTLDDCDVRGDILNKATLTQPDDVRESSEGPLFHALGRAAAKLATFFSTANYRN